MPIPVALVLPGGSFTLLRTRRFRLRLFPSPSDGLADWGFPLHSSICSAFFELFFLIRFALPFRLTMASPTSRAKLKSKSTGKEQLQGNLILCIKAMGKDDITGFVACIHDMASDELLLRHSAYRSVLAFVEFSALVIGQEREVRGTFGENMEVYYSCWTETCVRRIIDKLLLKYVGDALTGGWSIPKEWIDLLREMIWRLLEIPDLKTLKALCSDDAEVDFFNNLTHLKMHRRARALMCFRDVARRGELYGVIKERLFVPLFMSMLFDIKDKDEHLKRTCLDALASISGQME